MGQLVHDIGLTHTGESGDTVSGDRVQSEETGGSEQKRERERETPEEGGMTKQISERRWPGMERQSQGEAEAWSYHTRTHARTANQHGVLELVMWWHRLRS